MTLRINEEDIAKIAFNLDDALKRTQTSREDLKNLRNLVESDKEIPGPLKDWFVSN